MYSGASKRSLSSEEEKLGEASTHKSAKIHAGIVFVLRDLDLWPFDTKINGFPGLWWNISMSSLVILAE